MEGHQNLRPHPHTSGFICIFKTVCFHKGLRPEVLVSEFFWRRHEKAKTLKTLTSPTVHAS